MSSDRRLPPIGDQPGLRALAEGEERYWRRRANRRVRKARLTRNLARWSLIVTLQLAFGGLVGYTALRMWDRVSHAEEFALGRIEIVGAQRADRKALRETLAPYRGRFLPGLNLVELETAVRRDPWVRDAVLKLVLPDTLRVEVRERTPCAVGIIGGLAHVVDCEGFVIGPSGVSAVGDLPVLTGLAKVENERLPQDLKRGVELLERLRAAAPGFVDGVSELDLGRPDRVTARTIDGGPLVLLDPDQVDRNVARFLALWPAMSERIGATSVVDLRWQDRVTVLPRPATVPNES